MSEYKKFDYEKAMDAEKQKNPGDKKEKSIQDYVMKGLQIGLGILMGIFHA